MKEITFNDPPWSTPGKPGGKVNKIGFGPRILRRQVAESDMEPMLQFFTYEHLPSNLQMISKPFCDMAKSIAENIPRNPERTAGLRKLLEAKDCIVRAHIYKNDIPTTPTT